MRKGLERVKDAHEARTRRRGREKEEEERESERETVSERKEERSPGKCFCFCFGGKAKLEATRNGKIGNGPQQSHNNTKEEYAQSNMRQK